MLPFAVSTAATCYYYYAAFNAPCVGHEDDEAQALVFCISADVVQLRLSLDAARCAGPYATADSG